MRRLAFLYSPAVEALSYPANCPFKTQRAGLTRGKLLSLGLLGTADQREVAVSPASFEALQRFHRPAYLEELRRAAAGDLTVQGFHMGIGGPDTPVFPHLYEYGAWACGAALKGAELLVEGQADIAFNLLGGFHHAKAAHAGGFCYLNDVVLACGYLAEAGKRVVYLDVDAHHGDGVQEAFYQRNDVLTISLHETGRTLFPWGGFEEEIGIGVGFGYNINVPLPPGVHDEAFVRVFDRIVMPVLEAYDPDCVVLELGMDALAGDPLTHLALTNNAYVEVLQAVLGLERPLLVAGGGGYHVENTVRGWALAWQTCSEEDGSTDFSLGLGGVMLGSTEWAGGLRDRSLPVSPELRGSIQAELDETIAKITKSIFPHHGIGVESAISGNAAQGC